MSLDKKNKALRLFPILIAAFQGFTGGMVLRAQSPAQTCTAANIRGVPVEGIVCGGSSHALNCTAGAIYNCKSGPIGTQNNCKLAQACAIGCVANSSQSKLADSCFSGPAPLTVAPQNTLGGNDLAVTVQLTDAHPGGAYVNLKIDRGDLVPGAYCAPPEELAPGQNSASFGLSSAVVSSSAAVHIFTDLAYANSSGSARELVTVPKVVTLSPGGTAPPTPPLASFTLSPSTIGPAGLSLMDVVLTRMAPATGVSVAVSSSNPGIASVVVNGQPTVLGSCLTGGGTAAIQAANSVSQQTSVTIGATSGAAGEVPLTQPLTVTAGCVPNSCSGGPSCGVQDNGCGGTMTCGCTNLANQTCGGGGVPNQCGPPVLAVTAVTLNPSIVISGNTSVGTVTLNMAAPSGGALVGLSSSNSFVTVPATITVPAGQTSSTFTVNTTSFQAGTVSAAISAARADTVSAILTVNAAQ